MLTIRLQRAGKKHQTQFRVVLADKKSAASKKFQEVLANYDPHTKSLVVKDQERLQYWIAQKVQLSPTVHNLLVSKNIISEPKTKAFTIPKKPVEAVAPEAPVAEAATETSAEVPAEEVVAETPTEETPVVEATPEVVPEAPAEVAAAEEPTTEQPSA
jgi:small subunit ribosomal protein S16